MQFNLLNSYQKQIKLGSDGTIKVRLNAHTGISALFIDDNMQGSNSKLEIKLKNNMAYIYSDHGGLDAYRNIVITFFAFDITQDLYL